jgi:chromosome segregation protein
MVTVGSPANRTLLMPRIEEPKLLKLKKLQILGFKSFCDRTELKFHGDGLAAIVGPNGCGKSNISDAIAWVLGEQSAKTLRGARMEDVIFAGTRERKALGMAEVSLTLIDPDIYDGPALGTEPEIEIENELPENDWDEAAEREQAHEEAERAADDLQPGKILNPVEEMASTATPHTAAAVEDQPEAQVAETKGVAPLVVLKIRRRKLKPQTFHAGEIAVTRRLFRSGDSEYLLNGKSCRLRDIQELFMGTGLGPESYALIEQGRIGQILSSRPHDRRAIIEEAAGITGFKTKKRLSEARLEESKLNLARINDIFEEVTRQMNSLKRQAAKAERYGRLRDEMRIKLRVVLASKFALIKEESRELQSQMTTLAEEMRAGTEALHAMETEQTERTQRGYALEDETRQMRDRLASIAMEIDRAQARQRTNEERCQELIARAAAATTELAEADYRFAALAAERDSNRQILESAAGELAIAQQEHTGSREAAGLAVAEVTALEHRREECRVAMLEAASAVSNLRNQMTQAEERIAALDRESNRIQAEIVTSSSQLTAFGGERGQTSITFESVTQKVQGLTHEIGQIRLLLEQKRSAETSSKARLDSLRAEYATALGRKGSLEALIAEHGYSTESVRNLFQSGAMQGNHAPAGVLADFLEVDPRYERVVEDFLRDELNYIVVKSWDTANEGMRLLRSDVDGRATFLVHPNDSQAKFSFVMDENARREPENHGVVPMKNCIRVLNGFGKSLEVVLPKLGNGYIVPEASLARDLALNNPDAFFLSQSGECFHNVTVTGGRQRTEGPLSMKRELRDLLRQISELEHTLRTEEGRVMLLAKEIRELSGLLDRLDTECREAEKQAMTSGHMLRQLDSELARTRERLGTCEKETARLAQERAGQAATIEDRSYQLSAMEEHRGKLELEMASALEELAALKETRDRAIYNVSQKMARVASLEERHRSATAVLERIESMVLEMASRCTALRAQVDSAAAEKQQRQAENVLLAEQLVTLAAEKVSSEERVNALQEESAQIRGRITELDEVIRTARQTLDAARDRRGELAAVAAKLESDSQHMAETCLQELNTPHEDLMADADLVRVSGEELTQEDELYRNMRTRLENMGPVNMMALEEYKESSERHAFLETQRKDLYDAIENLRNTIREIETVSREKFQLAFAKINENFSTIFTKLFNGGQAYMRLTDELNTAESGIDIVASPPGKKLQNVLLLSGGEKALTAISLLAAIFQFAPSPFCILDEVDAPLDEANVGRFTELIKEMSIQTQFVVITHSKKTMSAAPVLYGVTMQEPGVSKLVSVRFGATA